MSCAEIKASEGDNAVSGNYWFNDSYATYLPFDSIKPGEVVFAPRNACRRHVYLLSKTMLLEISLE